MGSCIPLSHLLDSRVRETTSYHTDINRGLFKDTPFLEYARDAATFILKATTFTEVKELNTLATKIQRKKR